jgi:hypothetical protein
MTVCLPGVACQLGEVVYDDSSRRVGAQVQAGTKVFELIQVTDVPAGQAVQQQHSGAQPIRTQLSRAQLSATQLSKAQHDPAHTAQSRVHQGKIRKTMKA